MLAMLPTMILIIDILVQFHLDDTGAVLGGWA